MHSARSFGLAVMITTFSVAGSTAMGDANPCAREDAEFDRLEALVRQGKDFVDDLNRARQVATECDQRESAARAKAENDRYMAAQRQAQEQRREDARVRSAARQIQEHSVEEAGRKAQKEARRQALAEAPRKERQLVLSALICVEKAYLADAHDSGRTSKAKNSDDALLNGDVGQAELALKDARDRLRADRLSPLGCAGRVAQLLRCATVDGAESTRACDKFVYAASVYDAASVEIENDAYAAYMHAMPE